MSKNWNVYRILRIVLAFFCLCICTGAVWFFPGSEKIFLTQAGSDFLKLLSGATLGVVVALLLLVCLTLLLGRAYCSVLCPLGVLQDVLGIFRRGKFKRNVWQKKIRYAVLAFTVLCAVCGLMLPLTLLMPSSSFVLLVNNVFREVVQYADDAVHFLPEVVTLRPALTGVLLSWGILLILLFLVRWKGRIYCNTLCPVGAVLGLISQKALFRIRIDPEKCVSCGACEKACKGSCIDAAGKKVDVQECVLCMNCLGSCQFSAIHFRKYSGMGKEAKKEETLSAGPALSRRAFLGTLCAAGTGAVLGASVKILSGKGKKIPPMPPGAGDFDSFTSKCLGCSLCISACRGKVLKQSITQYGAKGFLQPYLDMFSGACLYDCRRCQEVCPCGALRLMDLVQKQRCRIGFANYVKERCVSFLRGEDCGACSEHCPVGAIDMVEYKNTLIPKVNEKLCIGCGACQNICPVRPLQAIVVEGTSPQIFVEKPKQVKQTKLAAEEDFPF